MRLARWFLIAAAVLAAVPFGWLLGVFVAQLLIGKDVGVFPVLTIPLGLAAAIAFALAPRIDPLVRLVVLAGGTGAFFLLL